MARRLLETGELSEWQAVTPFNRPVFESYDQIVTAMRRYLGPQHAAFFAEPQISNGRIAWFTGAPGQVRPWHDLSGVEGARLERLRFDLVEQIRALTATFAGSGPNTSRGNFSHILESAIVSPEIAHLYAVGDQPVLTFWGFRSRVPAAEQSLEPLPQPFTPSSSAATARSPASLRTFPALLFLVLLLCALGWWGFADSSSIHRTPAALPTQQWDKRNLSTVSGCWLLGKEAPAFFLRSSGGVERGITRVGSLCFDAAGQGTWIEIHDYQWGSVECQAKVTVAFDPENRLRVRKPTTRCDGPHVWVARNMTCTHNDHEDSARCVADSAEFGSEPRLFRRQSPREAGGK